MKATRVCSIEGCDKPASARGWCGTHWARWRSRGTTDDPPPRGAPRIWPSPEERLAAKLAKVASGCIESVFVGTYADNNLDMARKNRHGGQRKTHCPQGHEYSEANIYWVMVNGERRWRQCRTCRRERQRKQT